MITRVITGIVAMILSASVLGCATATVNPNAPTDADKAVVKLLNSKRPGKEVNVALKTIKPYADLPARLVETIKEPDGSIHEETEVLYPELGIKVFFYDNEFSGADTLARHERRPGM